MNTYNVRARNFSESSENRIHSDQAAQKFGFRGALVPGVAVYGHLVHPLVDKYGPAWLDRSVDELRLLKPAYDGDELTIRLDQVDGVDRVQCYNQLGELLATLNSAAEVPPYDGVELLNGPIKHPERVEICWDNVQPNQCFAPWEYLLCAEDNETYKNQVLDQAPIYDEYVHPHLLLSLANTALTNEYAMPMWMHVGSETRHRHALRVGDTIDIRTVTIDRWQKKGHEFIRTHTTFWRDEELTTDILHTAIFKVAS